MPITLNGSGTVSGISAGGLPDGIIQSADIASGVLPAESKILQYKHAAANSGNFSTTSTDSIGADVSGMATSITLTSSSNKVLIILSCNPYIGGSGAGRFALKLYRDTTMIYEETYANFRESDGTCKATRSSHIYLDNPADTNSHTYKVVAKKESGSNTLYFMDEGANSHTITLLEVAA
tara:strand:- start:44 stop:580 length:537 start_codon:yes stop_codon:yes gene_type:complete